MIRGLFATFLATLLAATLLLSGCGDKPPAFDNLDISDSKFDTAYALPDTKGIVRTPADFKGKVVVMFFGFTQCPDVCPTGMAELAEARKQLGENGNRLQVIFVSLDPDRDTPAVLKEYVSAFDPSFIALRPADDAAVAALAKRFHIYAAKTPLPGGSATPASSAYTLDHTAASFVFDPAGKLRLYARDGQGVPRWLHDIPLLLRN